MGLSLRMQRVADMVEPCERVADIGCDHGYVSIYLVEQGIADHVLAMDVRKGPLSRAEANIRQKQLQTRIECRLSDGLERLQPGEADTILLAGMGGPLMIDILTKGSNKRLGTETLIVQPQSDIPEVRRYLHRIGYEITAEDMLQEDGKYYTVMKAKPSASDTATDADTDTDTDKLWSEAEEQYGKLLLEKQSPVLKQYLEREERQLTQLQEQLNHQATEKANQRLAELQELLKWNREAQGYYEIKKHHELS